MKINTITSMKIFTEITFVLSRNLLKKNAIILVFLTSLVSHGQLLTENFSYTIPGNITAATSNWSSHSGSTFYPQYTNAGLAFTGHAGSSVGGSMTLASNGVADINRTFTSQNSGTVYMSCLVNFTSTTSASTEYFLHFNSASFSTRVLAQKSGSVLRFGINKSANPTAVATNFEFGTTYLLVVKYTFIAGSSNDRVDLWVLPSFASTEALAGTPLQTTTAGTDATALNAISVRQATPPVGSIDAINIGTTWASAVPAGTIAPTVTTTTASSISVDGGSSGGDVTADGGATVTARGLVYNTASSPTLSNSVVTTGTGTGSYISILSGLDVNTRYYYRAYATNSAGTSYGNESNFYTLANVPGALVVTNPQATTLDVMLDGTTTNLNPANTTFAIETDGQYVQANGFLGATAVWQTADVWGTVTVKGLVSLTTYIFKTKARNGDQVETGFGDTNQGTTTGAVAPVVSSGSPVGNYNSAFSYSVMATNSPTSYAISSGSLPTGLDLNTTSGEISGTPTQIGIFNVDFTASNAGGASAPATISITINQANQTISFGALSPSTYGDAPFELMAAASSGLTVSYVSSNTDVATVSGNTITIIGQGSTTISASQTGNVNYTAATTVDQTLTVNKKNLTIIDITANNKVQDGTTAATLSGTPTLVGVVSGEESNVVLNETYSAAFAVATPGTGISVAVTGYTLTGSASANYTLLQPTGLTADIAVLNVPDITVEATNILNNGFTANWDAVPGAASYVLDVYTKSGGSSEILNQQFTWVDLGSANGTGGNSGGWSGTIATEVFDLIGWSDTAGYRGDNCAKMGAGSTRGALTTPVFGVAGNAVLTFRAGAWNGGSEQTTLLLEITGGGTLDVSSVTMIKGAFSDYTVQVTDATINTQITFRAFQTSNARFFLDDIKVVANTLTITPVAGSPFSINAPLTSYNVTGLNANTNYYYQVRAVNGLFTTGNSDEINLVTNQATVTWNGTEWSNVTGPTATIEAFIQGIYNTNEHGVFTASKLTLTSGSFTINDGDDITVIGGLINNMTAADFVVENNANLIQEGTVNNNIGNITIKRNSSAINRFDYTLWSSPVTGQGLYAFSPLTLSTRFYQYLTATNFYNNSGLGFSISGA
ncbi:beta strand repeat-containing protein, partial [Flavobacterium sp. UBA7682]|uniref:beta strand repeat-containing protein n=1 Tax=Flavobacterium sp. UBA7682 TaxID=1946560 RepID=UPI0025C459A9